MKRYDFVYLFDVTDGNPNGDPDAGNLPRVDPETGHGLVTDVCLKRKVRNYIGLVKEEQPPYEIYVKEKAVLNSQQKRAYIALDEDKNNFIEEAIPADLEVNFVKKVISAIKPKADQLKVVKGDPACLRLSLFGKLSAMKKKCKADEQNGLNQDAVDFVRKLLEEASKKSSERLEVSKESEAQKWMCKNFFDIRTFGAVMSTGDFKCGQVRGPVQMAFSRSIDPIFSAEHTLTVCAARKEAGEDEDDSENLEKQIGIQGRKFTVPYGLYHCHGFINPFLADQTGFGEEDLMLFWQALENAFEFDRSAARGQMAARALVTFEHDSPLGNGHAHQLQNRIKVKTNKTDQPIRRFEDYDIKFDDKELPISKVSDEKSPAGITIRRLF